MKIVFFPIAGNTTLEKEVEFGNNNEIIKSRIVYARMRFVTVYFEDGNQLSTSIRGSVGEIVNYYYLRRFELDETKPPVLCIALAIQEP